MIILCDTSTSLCRLTLVADDGKTFDDTWEAGRDLAHNLLAYLRDQLAKHNWTFDDCNGIGVMKGPGSFTGLRIGLTVLNTIADAQAIPIVGESGEDWQAKALKRLATADNDQIVMPDYGSDANITRPRK